MNTELLLCDTEPLSIYFGKMRKTDAVILQCYSYEIKLTIFS